MCSPAGGTPPARREWLGALVLGVALAAALPARPAEPAAPKPLFKDFMGINGHFTFKPDLYRQVARLVRNYHNVNWDVRQPGDTLTLPVCVNQVNWQTHVYGPWHRAGWETDICLQFTGFQPGTPDYQRFWTNREAWCFDYGKAVATAFGPSAKEPLCTSIEIGNEPGSKFDPAIFRLIFENLARGIRAGDPKVRILTPAVQARTGDDYIQDVRGLYADPELLPLYDVINLHTYSVIDRKNLAESPWNRSYPEDPLIAYLKIVDEAIAWRDQRAPGKEIWVTEFGYDACTPEAMARRTEWALKLDWQGATDLQQAQYLVRSFLAFAERDVARAYIYYYDDDDSPSFHGSSGLTRKFVPKPSFWAVKQLYETLGECRFRRVVQHLPGELAVQEYARGDHPQQLIWVVWSPTGARTHEKDRYTPRQAKVTLKGLPALPERVIAMATTAAPPAEVVWEKAGKNAISLTVTESPAYLILRAR